ncbi:MAG: hypothetical protein M0P73_00870 [Syntrophobacterales bacterium]|jgi:hypothetical protein|nr:hypothetical protein [Syntrophobacterales bacterium]
MRSANAKIGLFLVLSFLAIFVIGCSRPMPTMQDLEGKWVAVKKEAYTLGGGQTIGFVIEFFNDKTVMLPSGKGTWTILKDGRVQIEVPGIVMLGSLEGDTLTITMPKNQGKVIFKKKK